MAELALPEVRRSQVGDVPAFWAEAPAPHEVQLLFRVGRADETLSSAGITHLVEHLAMPAEPVSLECNAFVSYLITGFWARGEMAELSQFVAEVAGRLSDLPLERLDVERRILLAEGDLGVSADAFLASRRFGATGFGLSGFPELGLKRLDEEAVRDWTRLRFTGDNAALVVAGPLHDFELSVPSGPRHAIPQARPVPAVRLPSFVNWAAEAVSLSLLLPREPVGEAAAEVLRSRAARRLRFEAGLVYGVDCVGVPLTAELASVTLGANCLLDRAPEVRDLLLALLDELAAEGPTADELEAGIEAIHARAADPALAASLLHHHAFEHLVGLPWKPAAESFARLAGVTPAEIAAIVAEALETAVLALPGDLVPPEGSRFHPPPETPGEPAIMGKEFRPRGVFFGSARRARFVVGENGVTQIYPDGDSTTIRWERCAAVTAWRDGVRGLWGESGWVIYLWPLLWRHGEKAVQLVDELAPPDLVVDMGDDPSPPLFPA
jgi:predicted Zn-dependent peptidase